MEKPATLLIALVALACAIAVVVVWRRWRASRDHIRFAIRATAETAATATPTASVHGSDAADASASSADAGAGARETWTALHRLAFSLPTLEPGYPPEHERIAARVAADVANTATQERYMPRRPMLLPQLLRAINDNETSRRELARIISGDPALAADLLRLANSPFYRASAKPVESIDRAVAVLGTEGIRKLVATAIMQPVFRVRSGHFPRFPDTTWDQAFRSAVAAESFAAIVDNSDPFAAQLLALVVGLGAIIVFRMTMDRYGDETTLTPAPQLFAALIDTHASRAAHAVAASWALSDRMLTAIDEQHAGADALSPLGRSVMYGRLTGALAVLRAAGAVTDEAALATLRGAGTPAQQTERIWLRLVPESAATIQGAPRGA